MPKFLTALCLLATLSACGQSGALYLPDRGHPPAKQQDPQAKLVKLNALAEKSDAAKPDAPPAPSDARSPAPTATTDDPAQPTPTP